MAKQKEIRTLETAFNTYTLQTVIGEGGAGRVWLATDSSSSNFAVKILNSDRATTERRKRFKNEIAFCQTNAHPNIVRVLDYGVDLSAGAPAPFYVMPHYQGSFRKLVSAKRGPHLLPLFDAILSGVEAAHQKGVIHRDIKPENVLVEDQSAVVADFGIAHFSDNEIFTLVQTAPDSRLANFTYAAPEQKVKGKGVDHRADIFALGLMLNEIFTGDVPHAVGYRTVSEMAPEYGWLDDIVAQMIDTDPTKRPQTIDAVKLLLLARKLDFVQRQRLSQIQGTVIPVGAEDDPLAIHPPKVVDFDFDAGTLTILIDRSVPPQWIEAFYAMQYGTSLMGKPPAAFQWSGMRASVSARESEVQQLIDIFKQWMPTATETYKQVREKERKKAEERQRAALAAQQEEIERKLRLKKNIRL